MSEKMLEKFAFGTYRTTYKNQEHVDALNYALDNGIKYIDTSSNYMHGDAQILIGNALKQRNREEFFITSKGGYIQGELLKQVEEGKKVEDLVCYDSHCFHCIHPHFLEEQIDNALKHLQTSYIDVYLLHNPEYYLLKEIQEGMTKQSIQEFQKSMQERIKKAFAFLETQVNLGKIKAYGISSNSFAKKKEDIHFLEYQHLLDYAIEIAGENHHFKVIQLPLNLFEQEGIACAQWAHEKGLEVHVNRPLNAFKEEKMIRLASYENPKGYEQLLQEVRSIPNATLQEIITQIIAIENEYVWAGDVDDIMEYQIIPYIVQHAKVEIKYLELLQNYLDAYKQKIKHTLSKQEAQRLSIQEPMEKKALDFLAQKEYITRILVGMRKESYVKKVIEYALS